MALLDRRIQVQTPSALLGIGFLLEDIIAFFFRLYSLDRHEMETTAMKIDLDPTTIKYLLGELGIETLGLIAQGCMNDEEIIRLSTVTKSCLDVKVPLLETLGLIKIENGIYFITELGNDILLELTGWKK